jgi:hypothetical protein
MTTHRILILGGGFGGVYAARRRDQIFAHRDDVEITLLSGENFLLFTPMLAEVVSSSIEASHIISPIRAFFRRVRFQNSEVKSIDLERRVVEQLAIDSALMDSVQNGLRRGSRPCNQCLLLGGASGRGSGEPAGQSRPSGPSIARSRSAIGPPTAKPWRSWTPRWPSRRSPSTYPACGNCLGPTQRTRDRVGRSSALGCDPCRYLRPRP